MLLYLWTEILDHIQIGRDLDIRDLKLDALLGLSVAP